MFIYFACKQNLHYKRNVRTQVLNHLLKILDLEKHVFQKLTAILSAGFPVQATRQEPELSQKVSHILLGFSVTVALECNLFF